MTKYTFKTIVAPEAVRADFTTLRDQLNSSDKELMQAIWNYAKADFDAIESEVKNLQDKVKQVRIEKQEFKAAAKLKEKEVVVVKEEKAPKAKKVVKDKRVELVVVGEA